MTQEVKVLPIKKLVLWTENPRDPIRATASDQDIVDVALEDRYSKWNLSKLSKDMGDYYDFSELPTVVFHGKNPVVYDGNRRVILGKIKHGLVQISNGSKMLLPDIPAEIPCNVCSKDVALQNVLRKHAETGSWLPLERDIFLHKHMKEKKSLFLILEENTGMISANPHLNQRFVKEEIFREDVLNSLGIGIEKDKITSKNNAENTKKIFLDISKKVEEKEISTRNNRGKVFEVLDPAIQQIIDQAKKRDFQDVDLKEKSRSRASTIVKRQAQRVKPKATQIFGGVLYLKMGGTSNLYRDIVDLYNYYLKEKTSLSATFPSLFRMALRLLCEAAAKDCNQTMDQYIDSRFAKVKSEFDSDIKTTLANQNVNAGSLKQLLHTGAHNYTASANLEQTLAVSVVVGAMLVDSHGQIATK